MGEIAGVMGAEAQLSPADWASSISVLGYVPNRDVRQVSHRSVALRLNITVQLVFAEFSKPMSASLM